MAEILCLKDLKITLDKKCAYEISYIHKLLPVKNFRIKGHLVDLKLLIIKSTVVFGQADKTGKIYAFFWKIRKTFSLSGQNGQKSQ